MKIDAKHHFIYENASVNPKEQYSDELMVVLETVSNIVKMGGAGSNIEYLGIIASQFLCLLSRAESMEELEINCKLLASFLK